MIFATATAELGVNCLVRGNALPVHGMCGGALLMASALRDISSAGRGNFNV
jgi:hypothetical protein